MKSLSNNHSMYYNVYNSLFFAKFSRLVLKRGQRIKAENMLLFLFTKLKKKKYIIFLYFYLLRNTSCVTPLLKKVQRSKRLTKKYPLDFTHRYLAGLKLLSKCSTSHSMLQLINDSLWQLLQHQSTFYINKQELDSTAILNQALNPTGFSKNKKKFKKKVKKKKSSITYYTRVI